MENINIPETAKKHRNKKILAAMALAVLFAAVACFGAYRLLAPTRAAVFVFNNDYSAGTQVTRNMLSGIQVDAAIIDGGAKVSAGEYFVTGSSYNAVMQSAGILRTDVKKGSALMTSMLTSTGGNAIEMNMKPEAIAVTIAVTGITGVTNDLKNGSRVNVYASYGAQTILLLQNIRVLRTTSRDGALGSATLETDHEQSLELIHASTYGFIHLGIVDMNGYRYTQKDKPTYDLGGFEVDAKTQDSEVPSISLPKSPVTEEGEGLPEGIFPTGGNEE
jgi:Flp pilus assembly protein CpaB